MKRAREEDTGGRQAASLTLAEVLAGLNPPASASVDLAPNEPPCLASKVAEPNVAASFSVASAAATATDSRPDSLSILAELISGNQSAILLPEQHQMRPSANVSAEMTSKAATSVIANAATFAASAAADSPVPDALAITAGTRVSDTGTSGCPHCSKSFTRACDMRRHVSAVHDRLRPAACDRCERCFARATDLTAHKAAVHEGMNKLNACSQPGCSASYRRSSDLRAHIRDRHGIIVLPPSGVSALSAATQADPGAPSVATPGAAQAVRSSRVVGAATHTAALVASQPLGELLAEAIALSDGGFR